MLAASITPSDETIEGTDLRVMAFQMRSTNFGQGGRIVQMPSKEQKESVTAEEIDNARRYYWEIIARKSNLSE